jgi:hypothetical protein
VPKTPASNLETNRRQHPLSAKAKARQGKARAWQKRTRPDKAAAVQGDEVLKSVAVYYPRST